MTTRSALVLGSLETAGPMMLSAVVLGFVFAECAFVVGLFLPGDSLLLMAGVVLAQHGDELLAWALAVAGVVVATAGNQLGYYVGQRTGARLLARKGGKVLNVANMARVGRLLGRYGFWAIVLARWVPWIRTLAPMAAGAAGMDARKYLAATALGALAWVPTLLLFGYYGAGLLAGHPWLRAAALVLGLGFFTIGTGYGLWRYRQEMRKPVEQVPADAGRNVTT